MIYDDFEDHLKDMLTEMRKQIAEETSENSVTISIIATGRLDGDFSITFGIDQRYDSDYKASGGYLGPVVHEFIRRACWRRVNQPTCLPTIPDASPQITPPAPPVDDEIPF